MNRAKEIEIGKWVAVIVGAIAIFGALAKGIGTIYAEDKRIGDVEETTAMMPCLLWDLQILKADARSRNPVRYDSLVQNQIQISGPRPVIQGKE
jgi:hypothetical protein